jgi:bifunctional DNase/RNase
MTAKKIKVLLVLMGLWFIFSTCSSGEIPAQQFVSADMIEDDLLQVRVDKLIVDPTTKNPVVLLSGPGNKRRLYIWIGPSEARAIYAELEGIEHVRPFTHDLLARIISELNGEVQRIIITHARENVYYAVILINRDGRLIEIDARPSDSLVVALKFEAPVFVTKTLFEKMSLPVKGDAEFEDEYGLALQEITPDLSEYLSLAPKGGAMVSSIRKGSQAAKDGLKTGDIIVEVGGRSIENLESARRVLAESKPPLKVGIIRGGRQLTLKLHLP